MPHLALSKFARGYLEAALWTETEFDSDVSLSDNYDIEDIHPHCLGRLVACADAFAAAYADDLATYTGPNDPQENGGHDLWLTRNGHGAGYWDGDYPEPAASRLTEAAHKLSEISLYPVDGSQIYASDCSPELAEPFEQGASACK